MRIVLILLTIKALCLSLLVLYGPVHLAPDEAQYWLWSRFLDVGYYSKPPGVVWQIFMGTSLFGSTEWGVRVVAILFSFLLGLATYFLALVVKAPAKRAALIIAFCPLGILGGFAATTDGGFLLFWTVGVALLLRQKRAYALLGLCILLGALFKWTIFLLLPLALLRWPSWRLSLTFFLGALGLLPSLYWNFSHDFATFKHVAGQVMNEASGNPLTFILSQVALLFPPLFFYLLVAFKRAFSWQGPLKFLTLTTLALFAGYTFIAFFQKMQANWVVLAYPLAAVAISAVITPLWLTFSLVTSSLLSFLALATATPSSLFKQTLGWQRLKEILPKKEILIADRYQTTSLLSFYNPTQERAYFLNLSHHRKNQFSFWPSLAPKSRGLFVVIETRLIDAKQESARLKPYFEQIGEPTSYELSPGKWALLIPVSGYLGNAPQDPDRF